MKQALYYSPLNEGNKVRCSLCPHKCVIEEGKTGACGTRKNDGGKLYALTYGRYTSVNIDPIEKKPLYHFYPGSQVLSLGTAGCNLSCRFCQNHEISQRAPGDLPARELGSDDIAELAGARGSIGVAYTYNEPLINYEHLNETAIKIKDKGLVNILVTNGFLNEEPLVNLLPFIDAANVDVKSFKDEFYRKYCGGRLGDVLRTVEIMFKKKVHVEVTNLIIPGLNDTKEDISELINWVSSLSELIPVHFSRYYPCYKMTVKATPFSTLEMARDIAVKKLRHVYLGNVMEEPESNTYCPNCREILIRRRGYITEVIKVKEGRCAGCGEDVNIAGMGGCS